MTLDNRTKQLDEINDHKLLSKIKEKKMSHCTRYSCQKKNIR